MRDLAYPPVIVTAKTLFRMLGMRFQISGTEHIPRRGGAVLACNHISYVDFVFAGLAAQPSDRLVRFMAKKEAFDHRLGGLVMNAFHHIPVDRERGHASLETAVSYARAGEVVGIFPEATISRSMQIKEIKTGAVRIAADAGVPLIPMVVWGTQLLKTKDHPSDLWGRGKTIGLHVAPPLEVAGRDPVAETERLRTTMSTLLDHAISTYPVAPLGQWWAPASAGGRAPTPERAAELDAAEKAARAARKNAG